MGASVPRKPPQLYRVHRVQDGAEVRADLTLKQARVECAQLNAEARVVRGHHAAHVIDGVVVMPAYTEYGSMYLGEISLYEVRTLEGVVVP